MCVEYSVFYRNKSDDIARRVRKCVNTTVQNVNLSDYVKNYSIPVFSNDSERFRYRYPDSASLVPCSFCSSCQTKRARQTRNKFLFEYSEKKVGFSCTLTYAHDENLTLGHAREHFQKFQKDFRSGISYYYSDKLSRGLKFLVNGEYGDLFGRVHLHFSVVGFHPCDFRVPRRSDNVSSLSRRKHKLYCSDFVKKYWPHGSVQVSSITEKTVMYNVNYTTSYIRYKDKTENEDIYLDYRRSVNALKEDPRNRELKQRLIITRRAWRDVQTSPFTRSSKLVGFQYFLDNYISSSKLDDLTVPTSFLRRAIAMYELRQLKLKPRFLKACITEYQTRLDSYKTFVQSYIPQSLLFSRSNPALNLTKVKSKDNVIILDIQSNNSNVLDFY